MSLQLRSSMSIYPAHTTLLRLSHMNIIIGAVLVLHTPIIKYIFEIYLGIICIVGGKNGKENKEGLKTIQLSTVVVTLLCRYPAW